MAEDKKYEHRPIVWPELKFPPINLYSVWKTTQQANDHAKTLDRNLFN